MVGWLDSRTVPQHAISSGSGQKFGNHIGLFLDCGANHQKVGTCSIRRISLSTGAYASTNN
jgi:hypothetical protein